MTLMNHSCVLDAPWENGDDVAVDAYTLTIPEHERMVRRYVSALSRDSASVDDLSQEVFVRAIERIDRLQRASDAGGFLRGIARHVVQEHFRARRRDRHYDDLTLAAIVVEDRSVAANGDDKEMSQLLTDAITKLPVVSRRILEMRYHDGLSASQIAMKLDVSHGAVRISLLRIRDRLRRSIDRAMRSNDHS